MSTGEVIETIDWNVESWRERARAMRGLLTNMDTDRYLASDDEICEYLRAKEADAGQRADGEETT